MLLLQVKLHLFYRQVFVETAQVACFEDLPDVDLMILNFRISPLSMRFFGVSARLRRAGALKSTSTFVKMSQKANLDFGLRSEIN